MKPFYQIRNSGEVFRSEKDLSRFIKKLLLGDAKVFEIRHRKGDLVPYHAHKNTEMVLVLSGMVRLFIEEDIIDLKAGEMVTIEPYAIHLLAFPDNKGARFYLCSCDRSSFPIP